jgi:hypothetical protein
MTRMLEVPEAPFYQVAPTLYQIWADVNALPYVNMTAQGHLQQPLSALIQQAFFESTLDLIQLRIAIEQYHAMHGKYPQTLDAVSDWLGGTLPVDPLSGLPYPYGLDGDTYLLDETTPDDTYRTHADN